MPFKYCKLRLDPNSQWNLLPAHPAVNNEKRDRLPSQPLLQRRRDAVIGYWEALKAEHTERFDREAARLCGVDRFARTDWQISLFGRMAEAVEITAVQRCVPHWEPTDMARRVTVVKPVAQEESKSDPRMFEYAEVGDAAFRCYLPVVGALAAGREYSGFDVSDIESASECPWVAVPQRLAGRNRFVVRIAGDSMEPELSVDDGVVFEYHRSPRNSNQIVIANIAELGIVSDLRTEHAVKRLTQDADHWVFKSSNPRYDDIRVSKAECAYPILGIMVERL
jgi:SOS-response transcriptional repressor LexA